MFALSNPSYFVSICPAPATFHLSSPHNHCSKGVTDYFSEQARWCPDYKCWLKWARGSAKWYLFPEIKTFDILKVDQNISNTIKDQWEVPSVALWCTTWHSRIYSRRTIVEHVHHMSVSGYTQLRGDQMNIQREGCLCPLFLVLSTALVIVWVVISDHDGENLRGLEWSAGYLLNLDPGQNAPLWYMQGTSTSHTYHLTIRLLRVYRVVCEAPLGELCSKNNHQALQFRYYDIMHHIALLQEDQELRSCLSSSFYPLQSPQTDPLIDPVHLICATQPGVEHTSPIHV